MEGRESEARMKCWQAWRSIWFVLDGPPFPPAPVIHTDQYHISNPIYSNLGKATHTGAPHNPIRLYILQYTLGLLNTLNII